MILADYVGFYSARYKNDPQYQNFLRRLKDSPETSTYQSVPDGISRIDEGKFVLDMEGQFRSPLKIWQFSYPIPIQGPLANMDSSLRLFSNFRFTTGGRHLIGREENFDQSERE